MTSQKYLAKTGNIEMADDSPIRLRIRESTPTESIIELAIDFEKAPVPARAYSSDFVRIIKGEYEHALVFGKLNPGTHQLRNKVEISYPNRAFVNQLWSSTRDLLKTITKNLPVPTEHLEPQPDDTDMVQSFRANNAFIATLGDDALVDFYYIPPSDIHYARFGKRNKVTLDPVLRIVLSTPLLARFLVQLDTAVKASPELSDILMLDKKETAE
jgi:hypothetical protein